MQLPFNPIRLIIVCFSTLLIVGSITYFASDLNKKAQRLQSRQSQMGRVNPALQPSLPDMTSGDATSQTANSSQSPLPMTPGTPIPHQPQQPIPLQALSPTQENPDSSEADDDFENSLLPKNFIPWELKSVDELEHPELFKKPDDWQIFYLEDSGQTLRSFHENPNRYHGKFDLQTDLNVWASQLMLSLDLKFKNDLNKRKLSGNLRQQFGNSGISLSPNTTIMVQKKDNKWLITDEDDNRVYIVSKEENMLNSYSREPQDWTTMPWDELRKHYILRYPDQAKKNGVLRENESAEQMLEQLRQTQSRQTLERYMRTLYRTQYRLSPLK